MDGIAREICVRGKCALKPCEMFSGQDGLFGIGYLTINWK